MKEQYFEYKKELHKLLDDGTVWVSREEIDWDANKEDDEMYARRNEEEQEKFKENMVEFKSIPWFKRIFKKKPTLYVWGDFYTPLEYKKVWVKSDDPVFLNKEIDISEISQKNFDLP